MDALDVIDRLADHIAVSDITQADMPVGIIVFANGKIGVQYSLSTPRLVANARAGMALIEMALGAGFHGGTEKQHG